MRRHEIDDVRHLCGASDHQPNQSKLARCFEINTCATKDMHIQTFIILLRLRLKQHSTDFCCCCRRKVQDSEMRRVGRAWPETQQSSQAVSSARDSI